MDFKVLQFSKEWGLTMEDGANHLDFKITELKIVDEPSPQMLDQQDVKTTGM